MSNSLTSTTMSANETHGSASQLKSILVGLDGSVHSEAAVDLAIAWARRFQCMLVAIGVVDEPTIHGASAAISRSYQQAYDEILVHERRQIEQFLEKFAIRCSEAQVPFKLLEDEGQPCEKILVEAQRYDLILLGCETHFRAGAHDRACKTLEKVVRHTPRPVVAVPPATPAARGQGVLVAYDGSPQSARALQSLVTTGLHGLGPIHVLTVNLESSVAAARIAERAIDFLRLHDIPAKPVTVTGRQPTGDLLVQHARSLNVELLVLGAYGKPLLAEFLLGSTTCAVIKDTPIPVLLYH